MKTDFVPFIGEHGCTADSRGAGTAARSGGHRAARMSLGGCRDGRPLAVRVRADAPIQGGLHNRPVAERKGADGGVHRAPRHDELLHATLAILPPVPSVRKTASIDGC